MKATHCYLLIGLLAFCAAPALSAAENRRPNTAATFPAATVFTPPLRDAFLAKAEADLRKTAKVSPEFWPWLAKHPDLKTGPLVAKSPAPTVFAENLDLMRQAVGPAMADKYAGLHGVYVQTLKRQGGKIGQADAREAAKVLADKLAALPAEAQQSAAPPKGPGT